jgi:hypothetical protein
MDAERDAKMNSDEELTQENAQNGTESEGDSERVSENEYSASESSAEDDFYKNVKAL